MSLFTYGMLCIWQVSGGPIMLTQISCGLQKLLHNFPSKHYTLPTKFNVHKLYHTSLDIT
jgi:hypothetical protein